MLIQSFNSSGGDCSTQGFPISFQEAYDLTIGQDTAATPLIPSAPFAGVMDNFQVVNRSCNDLIVEIEFYSTNSDCDGCTVDAPITEVQTRTVDANSAASFGGLVVDYSIVGDPAVLTNDGEVEVNAERVTSTCCTLAGLTTTLNALVVPTI